MGSHPKAFLQQSGHPHWTIPKIPKICKPESCWWSENSEIPWSSLLWEVKQADLQGWWPVTWGPVQAQSQDFLGRAGYSPFGGEQGWTRVWRGKVTSEEVTCCLFSIGNRGTDVCVDGCPGLAHQEASGLVVVTSGRWCLSAFWFSACKGVMSHSSKTPQSWMGTFESI